MFVKFHRPFWHSFPAALIIFPLLGFVSVSRASVESRISVAVSPAAASVQAGGGSQQFTATVHNDRHNRGVRWTLSGAGCTGSLCGTLSSTTSATGTPVTYAAPPNVPGPATVILTATSVSNTAKSASATITVTGSSAALSVTISPERGSLTITQTLPVTATVQNDVAAAGVTWSVSGTACSGASCGTFANVTSKSATYVAPFTPGIYSITATGVADVTKRASNSIGVTDLSGVLTYHDDLARDGVNSHEYALTTSSVNTSMFGKLFSCTVDGAVYAQPLWVANLTINSVKRNVVFVATQHDSLFAFDADANPCVQLWEVSLIDSKHGGSAAETTVPSGIPGYLVGSGYGDITPEVGITGTPVIDPTTNTLYAVSKSVNPSGPTFYQRLHAIDITTGNEKFSGPANITSSITFPGTGDGGSTVSFNARQQNQRAGLALVNGVVYVAWASHEDTLPYYGWVIGFNPSTLAITNVLNVSPNVQYGGIWMGGGAPSADGNNNLYLITGNATFDVTNGSAPNNDYGDSFLQLSGSLAITSYFTPSDEATDAADDEDFGAGGAAVVLNLTSGTLKHLVIGGGKDGSLYLLNGDNMGGLGDSNAWQHFNIGTGIFATGAFWNNNYYIAGVGGPLLSYSFNSSTNLFNTSVASQSSSSYGFPGSTPAVSSTGSSNGIVWALDNSNYCTAQSPGCGPAVLHAYNATSLGTELWNNSMVSSDTAGNAIKFTVATVANGKVYIGTRGNNTGGAYGSTSVSGELDVYGLKPN